MPRSHLDQNPTVFGSAPGWFAAKLDRQPGQGEDAVPLALHLADDQTIFGVFDGMGGAGAQTVCIDGVTASHARFAANGLRTRIFEELSNLTSRSDLDAIGSTISSAASGFYADLDTTRVNSTPAIRGRLFRKFPTTCSIVALIQAREGRIWHCGDSRVYTVGPMGLRQMTPDHLLNNQDPLDNLSEDMPLSRCIDSTTPADFDVITLSESPPVVFCATDGCFGYAKTPMHFEEMLLTVLVSNDSWDAIGRALCACFEGHPDDRSFVIGGDPAAIGQLRTAWQARLNHVSSLVRSITEAPEDSMNQQIRTIWEEYKMTYIGYSSGGPA